MAATPRELLWEEAGRYICTSRLVYGSYSEQMDWPGCHLLFGVALPLHQLFTYRRKQSYPPTLNTQQREAVLPTYTQMWKERVTGKPLLGGWKKISQHFYCVCFYQPPIPRPPSLLPLKYFDRNCWISNSRIMLVNLFLQIYLLLRKWLSCQVVLWALTMAPLCNSKWIARSQLMSSDSLGITLLQVCDGGGRWLRQKQEGEAPVSAAKS